VDVTMKREAESLLENIRSLRSIKWIHLLSSLLYGAFWSFTEYHTPTSAL